MSRAVWNSFILLIFKAVANSCLEVRYIEMNSTARLLCKHDVLPDEFQRVKWYKSIRNDLFVNGNRAVVSWDGYSAPHTSENYDIDTNFSLVIHNTLKHNVGVFRCYITRNTGYDIHKYDVRVTVYGNVDQARTSTVQQASNVRVVCSHNLTTSSSDAMWYKSKKVDYFEGEDQAIASWTNGTMHAIDNYSLDDNFSLEIHSVSIENEALYRCISVPNNGNEPSASDTNITIYALPMEVPLIQNFVEGDTSFINCSVDYVYPLLYPELKFINIHQSYEIRNGDGTYNTSVSGKVPDLFQNTTVECSFPHFNYTGNSSHYTSINISVEDEAPHPAAF